MSAFLDIVLTRVRRGTFSLPPLEARVGPGEVAIICGPNGVGKTTILDAIGGFIRYSGHVRWGDTVIDSWPSWRRHRLIFSRVFQQAPLRISGADLLSSALLWGGGKLCDAALSLTSRIDKQRPIEELSGGQRRRISVAAALARPTPIFLLDEPFEGLDSSAKDALLGWIREICQSGQTVIVVQHNPPSCLSRLCSRWLMVGERSIETHTSPPIASRSRQALTAARVERGCAATGGGLVVRGVCLRRGGLQLRVEEFHVLPGECANLRGPNGSGKSSFLLTLAGALTEDQGEIWFSDRPLHVMAIRDRIRLGVILVPQHGRVFGSLSVSENLRSMSVEQASWEESLISHIVKNRGINARSLSSGEQLRVGLSPLLARLETADPGVALLDEPFSAASRGTRAEIENLIRRLLARGWCVVVAEHGPLGLGYPTGSWEFVSVGEDEWTLVPVEA